MGQMWQFLGARVATLKEYYGKLAQRSKMDTFSSGTWKVGKVIKEEFPKLWGKNHEPGLLQIFSRLVPPDASSREPSQISIFFQLEVVLHQD